MKIAIISDIHANLEALTKVLADIKSRGIDKIYCLGDIIAKGTHQQECVDLVRANCEVIIKGNCEDYYTSGVDLTSNDEQVIYNYKWVSDKLNDETKAYLKSLPLCHEFYLSGRLVRLIHAHPADPCGIVANIDSFNKYYELVLPSNNTISQAKADVLIYGHIHTPYVQKMYNRYIINAGSVGNAIDVFRNEEKDGNILNTTVANYLIVTGNLDSKDISDPFSFELVSIAYDIDKELKNYTDNYKLDSYISELKEGKYRDQVKIDNSLIERGINIDEV